MILPSTYSPDMTDDQIVQAYIQDGFQPEHAKAHMMALRHPEPGVIYD